MLAARLRFLAVAIRSKIFGGAFMLGLSHTYRMVEKDAGPNIV